MNFLAIDMLQNRFSPLPMNLHVIFCLIATALFVLLYFRTKKMSNVFWALICDATIILQWYGDPVTATGVGVCEIVLFVLLIIELRKEKKAELLASKKAENGAEEAQDDLSDIEKVVKSERKAIINEEIDVIGEAFEDDNK